eukprot:gene6700-13586_t
MEDLSEQARLAIKNHSVIQLYSAATPNGIKVAAALEEIRQLRSTKEDFDYEPHTMNLRLGETHKEIFSQIFPSGKIPALMDPHGPGGKPIYMFESGAILLYLAEKYHELLPEMDMSLRYEAIKWLFWGSTAVSSQIKLFGFYYKYCPHNLPYCVKRYSTECHRLLDVLNSQLSHGKDWIIGDAYTIADISIWPWIYGLHDNYGDAIKIEFDNFKSYPHVATWYHRCMAREASQLSLNVCPFVFENCTFYLYMFYHVGFFDLSALFLIIQISPESDTMLARMVIKFKWAWWVCIGLLNAHSSTSLFAFAIILNHRLIVGDRIIMLTYFQKIAHYQDCPQ